MSTTKTYLEEARYLVSNHSNWSLESLTNQYCKEMKCDQGTAIYFLEKAIEDDVKCMDPILEDDYDGI